MHVCTHTHTTHTQGEINEDESHQEYDGGESGSDAEQDEESIKE